MKFQQVIYTKVSPSVVKEQRMFYKNHVKSAFVRYVAYKGLLNDILTPAEIATAKKGHLPKYLDIHHIRPLSSACDDSLNDFSNLTVIHKATHRFINREYFQPQLKAIEKAPYGTSIEITIPVFTMVDRDGIKKCLTTCKNHGIISLKDGRG